MSKKLKNGLDWISNQRCVLMVIAIIALTLFVGFFMWERFDTTQRFYQPRDALIKHVPGLRELHEDWIVACQAAHQLHRLTLQDPFLQRQLRSDAKGGTETNFSWPDAIERPVTTTMSPWDADGSCVHAEVSDTYTARRQQLIRSGRDRLYETLDGNIGGWYFYWRSHPTRVTDPFIIRDDFLAARAQLGDDFYRSMPIVAWDRSGFAVQGFVVDDLRVQLQY